MFVLYMPAATCMWHGMEPLHSERSHTGLGRVSAPNAIMGVHRAGRPHLPTRGRRLWLEVCVSDLCVLAARDTSPYAWTGDECACIRMRPWCTLGKPCCRLTHQSCFGADNSLPHMAMYDSRRTPTSWDACTCNPLCFGARTRLFMYSCIRTYIQRLGQRPLAQMLRWLGRIMSTSPRHQSKACSGSG